MGGTEAVSSGESLSSNGQSDRSEIYTSDEDGHWTRRGGVSLTIMHLTTVTKDGAQTERHFMRIHSQKK